MILGQKKMDDDAIVLLSEADHMDNVLGGVLDEEDVVEAVSKLLNKSADLQVLLEDAADNTDDGDLAEDLEAAADGLSAATDELVDAVDYQRSN